MGMTLTARTNTTILCKPWAASTDDDLAISAVPDCSVPVLVRGNPWGVGG